jgi:signal transduction histidine kinase
MTSSVQLRLGGFGLAIVLVAVMTGWAAYSTWSQVTRLGEQFSQAQIESFKTADQFHANLEKLEVDLLRYRIHHHIADRMHFVDGWAQLNEWIDKQRPTLTTTNERAILDSINAAYDDYHAAAINLLEKIDGQPPANTAALTSFEKVEVESQKLMDLGYLLVGAHRESLTRLLADSHSSLTFVRNLILIALGVLLFLGAWVATIVYREMIRPLQLKLVESHAVIERQEKLAALGLLAAGVAHEIRNPLTAIKARLFTQQKHLHSGTPEHSDSEVIGQEINRLERIVKDFLLFARPSDPQWALFNAREPLAAVQTLLTPQLDKANIRCHLEPVPAGARLRADPQQIQQVLINLIQNAADSIGQDGTITLRARLDSKRLGERLTDVVVLEVVDTGRGIPPDVQKRLFDPFFSTKDSGTGLGLPIAARIVEKHGGALQYQTQVNHGTTFGIVLPRAPEDDSASKNPAH